MKQEAQFVVRGELTQVQEMVTLKGAPVVHLFLGIGGDKKKVSQVFRVEVYEESLQSVARGLKRGHQVQCSGRLTGRVSDRGYYNYSFYADALLVEPTPSESWVPSAPSATTGDAYEDHDILF